MENHQVPEEQIQPLESREPAKQDSAYMVPGAIVLAGIIVAGSILYSNLEPQVAALPEGVNPAKNLAENVLPLTGEDHILGDPNAPVAVIEFSDLECPFCKRFHETMKRVMQDYGETGKIAWAYRHFPLDSRHPKARNEARATECAGELGGNTAFWAYIDRVFAVTPSNNGLDAAELPKIAEYVGVNRAAFESCLAGDRHADRVEAQTQDAINSGGQGTPFTIIRTRDGRTSVINGAQSYEAVKQVIDAALK